MEKDVLYNQDSIHRLSEALARLSEDADQKRIDRDAKMLAIEACSDNSSSADEDGGSPVVDPHGKAPRSSKGPMTGKKRKERDEDKETKERI